MTDSGIAGVGARSGRGSLEGRAPSLVVVPGGMFVPDMSGEGEVVTII